MQMQTEMYLQQIRVALAGALSLTTLLKKPCPTPHPEADQSGPPLRLAAMKLPGQLFNRMRATLCFMRTLLHAHRADLK